MKQKQLTSIYQLLWVFFVRISGNTGMFRLTLHCWLELPILTFQWRWNVVTTASVNPSCQFSLSHSIVTFDSTLLWQFIEQWKRVTKLQPTSFGRTFKRSNFTTFSIFWLQFSPAKKGRPEITKRFSAHKSCVCVSDSHSLWVHKLSNKPAVKCQKRQKNKNARLRSWLTGVPSNSGGTFYFVLWLLRPAVRWIWLGARARTQEESVWF